MIIIRIDERVTRSDASEETAVCSLVLNYVNLRNSFGSSLARSQRLKASSLPSSVLSLLTAEVLKLRQFSSRDRPGAYVGNNLCRAQKSQPLAFGSPAAISFIKFLSTRGEASFGGRLPTLREGSY